MKSLAITILMLVALLFAASGLDLAALGFIGAALLAASLDMR